jgi:hypothetical protein
MASTTSRRKSPSYFIQPVVSNSVGAKQSDTPCRFDLLPPEAMFAIAEVLKQGADKYGEENWRGLTVRDNINHAIQHLYGWLMGDTAEDHLAHAACRVLFALSLHKGK